MIEELIGEKVVIDFQSHFVCLGTLVRVGPDMLELKNADLHDLRDTDTSRENYVEASVRTGIKRNRKRVFIFRNDIVAIANIRDVATD